MRSLSQLTIALGIIGISALIALVIFLSKSDVEKGDYQPKPILVDVMVAEPSTEQVKFTAYGTVTPDKKLIVNTEVSGRIIFQSPDLVEGGLLQEGEIILTIDPRDYELAVQQAEAEVTRAEFELRVEEGRQVVAKREWELLNPTLKSADIGEDLALRKPHLKEKQATLEATKSRLEKAKLDLERTILTSPFNALVVSENTEEGQYITPQTEVATLVDSDAFRVRVSVPFDKLKWIKLPEGDNQTGSKVIVTQTVGGSAVIKRTGKIVRLLGDVDPQGRLARLEIVINDPLGLKNGNRRKPLLLGTYVGVDFFGPKMKGVYKIPRVAIHNGNTLWIKNNENELEFRKVNIIFSEDEFVTINKGLEPGDEVILTPLSLPIPGTELRINGSDEG